MNTYDPSVFWANLFTNVVSEATGMRNIADAVVHILCPCILHNCTYDLEVQLH